MCSARRTRPPSRLVATVPAAARRTLRRVRPPAREPVAGQYQAVVPEPVPADVIGVAGEPAPVPPNDAREPHRARPDGHRRVEAHPELPASRLARSRSLVPRAAGWG